MNLVWNLRGGIHQTWVRVSDGVHTEGMWFITIESRPHYCDRGRWLAKVETLGTFPLDAQEGFPRYYFDLDRAKAELEAWVNAREEVRGVEP